MCARGVHKVDTEWGWMGVDQFTISIVIMILNLIVILILTDITVNQLRNVLRLITTMTLCSSEFEGCTGLTKYGLNTSGYPDPDSEDECERVEMEYEAYLREIGEL